MIKTEKNQTSKVTDEVDQLVQRSKKALAILSHIPKHKSMIYVKMLRCCTDNHEVSRWRPRKPAGVRRR